MSKDVDYQASFSLEPFSCGVVRFYKIEAAKGNRRVFLVMPFRISQGERMLVDFPSPALRVVANSLDEEGRLVRG